MEWEFLELLCELLELFLETLVLQWEWIEWDLSFESFLLFIEFIPDPFYKYLLIDEFGLLVEKGAEGKNDEFSCENVGWRSLKGFFDDVSDEHIWLVYSNISILLFFYFNGLSIFMLFLSINASYYTLIGDFLDRLDKACLFVVDAYEWGEQLVAWGSSILFWVFILVAGIV